MSKFLYGLSGGAIGAAVGYLAFLIIYRERYDVIFDPEAEADFEEKRVFYNPESVSSRNEAEKEKVMADYLLRKERFEENPTPPETGEQLFPTEDDTPEYDIPVKITKAEYKSNKWGYETLSLSYYEHEGIFCNSSYETVEEWDDVLDPLVYQFKGRPLYFRLDDSAILFEIVPKAMFLDEDIFDETTEDPLHAKRAVKSKKEALDENSEA